MIVLTFLVVTFILLVICKLKSDWPGLLVLLKEKESFSVGQEVPFKREVIDMQRFDRRRATTQLKPGGWEVGQVNGSGPPWYIYTEGGQSKAAIKGSEMYETIFTSIGKR